VAWGLRDYGTNPQIWDADPNCEHEWREFIVEGISGGKESTKVKVKDSENFQEVPDTYASVCNLCGAIRCELGREPTPQLYIKHLCDIFDAIKPAIADWGSLYVNLGDTYFGGGQGDGSRINAGRDSPKIPNARNTLFPSKSLALIPYDFAHEMVYNRGWILRNIISWHKCLSENTKILYKKNDIIYFNSIKDIIIDNDDIYVPTLSEQKENIWVKVKNITFVGKKNINKIITKNGTEIECTGEHKFPYRNSALNYSDNLKFNLKNADDISNKDYLFLNSDLSNLIKKNSSPEDYNNGFCIGFFVAEGNYIKGKLSELKNNDYSLAAQKRWKNKERIQKYNGIELSCGLKDKDNISKFSNYNININYYNNNCHVTSYNKELLALIIKYTRGKTSHDKYFSNDCFNESMIFMKGLIDGFLAGDGCLCNNRYRVGLTINDKLRESIFMLCRFVGYHFRYEGKSDVKLNDKIYRKQTFSIKKYEQKYRTEWNGLIIDKIESVEKINDINCYDIEIEQIYNGNCRYYNRYNHLYFLGNGVWTHNSNPMPTSAIDRFTVDFEPIFFFVKQRKYWYKQYLEEASEQTPPEGSVFGGTKYPESGTSSGIYSGKEYIPFTDDNGTVYRNKRTTWDINTAASKDKHFAQYPQALCDIPISCSCPDRICTKCGKPVEYVRNKESVATRTTKDGIKGNEHIYAAAPERRVSLDHGLYAIKCNCNAPFESGVVLDPFFGTGTTAVVALKQRKQFLGFDIKQEYADIADTKIRRTFPYYDEDDEDGI
jgi:hypothetical protein